MIGGFSGSCVFRVVRRRKGLTVVIVVRFLNREFFWGEGKGSVGGESIRIKSECDRGDFVG